MKTYFAFFAVLALRLFRPQNCPQSGGFENVLLSFSCGGTKTEVSEYDDVIHQNGVTQLSYHETNQPPL